MFKSQATSHKPQATSHKRGLALAERVVPGLFCVLLLLAACAWPNESGEESSLKNQQAPQCAADKQTEVSVMTYNVKAMVFTELTSAVQRLPKIAKLLVSDVPPVSANASPDAPRDKNRFDLVLLQEMLDCKATEVFHLDREDYPYQADRKGMCVDFINDKLRQGSLDSGRRSSRHPNLSLPTPGGDGLLHLQGATLTDVSTPTQNFYRYDWEVCQGFFKGGSDCLTSKGFTFARHTLGKGCVDVYNLHMDAGGQLIAAETRKVQTQQLIDTVRSLSTGKCAVIVAGDFNYSFSIPSKDSKGTAQETRVQDQESMTNLMTSLGLRDACTRRKPMDQPDARPGVDRVFFRSATAANGLQLGSNGCEEPEEFKREKGLSDHDALVAKLYSCSEP